MPFPTVVAVFDRLAFGPCEFQGPQERVDPKDHDDADGVDGYSRPEQSVHNFTGNRPLPIPSLAAEHC